MRLSSIIFLVICSFAGTSGFYIFNLFDIMGLSVNDLTISDTTVVDGPIVNKEKTKAIRFGDKTPDFNYRGNFFAYIAHTIFTSDDFTFATYFNVEGIPNAEHRDWTFLSMRTQENYYTVFQIGLTFFTDCTIVEGQEHLCDKKEFDSALFVDQGVRVQRAAERSTIPLRIVKKNTWMLLTVRFQGPKFTVSLDCKEMGTGMLRQQKTEEFAFGGYLGFSQSLISAVNELYTIGTEKFVGAIYDPIIINGKDALEFLNPCNPFVSKQNVNFDKFVQMTSKSVTPIYMFCKDPADDKSHWSGTSWKSKNQCDRLTCKNGVISSTYICEYCTDEVTEKKYKTKERWIKSGEPCTERYCGGAFKNDIRETPVTCPSFSCDIYGKMGRAKPADQCCDKCWSDSCDIDHKYYKGCTIRCTDGGFFECTDPKNGCWCPKGQVLDAWDYCIPSGECSCKNGDRTYMPGQSVRKSACSSCVCSHGLMACFQTC